MYYAVTRTNELQHHGIKGMKWGVRRYQNADGTYTSAGRKRRKKDYMAEARTMSDNDLKRANERLNLEKQYRELALKNTTSASVSEVLNKISSKSDKITSYTKERYGKKSKEKKAAGKVVAGTKSITKLSKKAEELEVKKKIKDANLDSLSDQELRTKVNRLRMEDQYATYKYEKQGKSNVSKIIDTAGDVIAIGLAVNAAYKYGGPIVKDFLNDFGGKSLVKVKALI